MTTSADHPTAAGAARAASSAVTPGVRATSEWVWRLGVIALGVYGLTRVLGEFSDIVIPILVAMLVAALLHPIVERAGRHVPHGLAALAVLLGALLVVVGLFALVGQQAASGFGDLSTQAQAGLTKVQDWLSTGPLHLNAATLERYRQEATTAVSQNQGAVVSGALGVAGTAVHVTEAFFITMFSTFFFLSSGQRIWAWLLRMLPGPAQPRVDAAARAGWVTLSHYVRATLIVAIVDGLGVGVGSALLNVPLALPLGVAVFLGAFIPVVGALVTGVLAILVALVAQGPVVALAVLGVVIAVNQLEAHILQPFLLGRAVNVHPLGVILAIAAGAGFAGILGALFAVPAAAVANTVITALVNGGHEEHAEQVAEDDAPLAPELPDPTDLSKTPDTQHGSVTGAPTGA